jgi:hypothetical protein
MKLKMLGAVFLALLLVVPVVAQETTETVEDSEDESGVTPDSPLYGLDRAIERLQLSLTFDRAAKAKMGLRFAAERLEEVRQMIEEKKISSAERAKTEYDEIIETVEEDIDQIVATSDVSDLEIEIDIETSLDELVNRANDLKERLSIKIKGTLNPEEELLVQDLIDSFKTRAEEVKIQVKNKKNEIMIKIKERTGKSLEEIENEFEEEFEEEEDESEDSSDKSSDSGSSVSVGVQTASGGSDSGSSDSSSSSSDDGTDGGTASS